jgi:cupin fold WbuC family metalloprotein
MKIVDLKLLDELTAKAQASDRKRSHHNLHDNLDEDIHRLCMGAEPGTYIRPHRHFECDKWELFIALRGKVAVLTYDDNGCVKNRIELTAGGAPCAIELSADTWHNFVSLESGSVVMEVKRGPYEPPTPNDSASWAPAENDDAAPEFGAWYLKAQPGDSYSKV